MKAPGLLLLLAAAVILGAVAWFLHQRDAAEWRDESLPAGSALLPEIAVNEVAAVRLRGPDGSVTLRRGEKGWGVAERADYPASFEKVATLVRRLSDLTALQSVPVGEGDLGVLSLREPGDGVPAEEGGLRVDLLAADGRELGGLILGKVQQTAPQGLPAGFGNAAPGRYVKPASAGEAAYLVAEAFPDLAASPASWIETRFVRPGLVERIEVKAPGKDRSWTIEREAAGAPWRLTGLRKNEETETSKLLSVDSLLGGLSVADVPDGPEDARLQPLRENPVVVVADTSDGLRYTITIGEGGADNLPARVAVAEVPGGPGATPEQVEARAAKLAEAQAFEGKDVFIPRNFVEPFLVPRSALVVTAAAPSPTPRPKSKR